MRYFYFIMSRTNNANTIWFILDILASSDYKEDIKKVSTTREAKPVVVIKVKY